MDSPLENSEVRKQLQQLGDFISKVLSGDVKLSSNSWTTRAGEKRNSVYLSADFTGKGEEQSYSLLVRLQDICTFYWLGATNRFDLRNQSEPRLESESGQDSNAG